LTTRGPRSKTPWGKSRRKSTRRPSSPSITSPGFCPFAARQIRSSGAPSMKSLAQKAPLKLETRNCRQARWLRGSKRVRARQVPSPRVCGRPAPVGRSHAASFFARNKGGSASPRASNGTWAVKLASSRPESERRPACTQFNLRSIAQPVADARVGRLGAVRSSSLRRRGCRLVCGW